jgi:hypothetical protein
MMLSGVSQEVYTQCGKGALKASLASLTGALPICTLLQEHDAARHRLFDETLPLPLAGQLTARSGLYLGCIVFP